MFDALVVGTMQEIEADRVVNLISRLSSFDRYQASLGINEAAELVATEAHDAGLQEVAIHRFPADGRSKWWCFEAISSWTPVIGRCVVRALGLVLDHATQPFTLATGSAPTTGVEVLPIVSMKALEREEVHGSIVVVPSGDWRGHELLERLHHLGARGFITDSAQRRDLDDQLVPGRIELPTGCNLFGFCTTEHHLNQFSDLKRWPLKAEVDIVIDHTASMPVVSGVIPGSSKVSEIWIIAHLCHPRPSANDNASGVAGSMEMARLLQSNLPAKLGLRPSCGIRFIWGPEFVGTAAFLHTALHKLHVPLPSLVINLDMIGEDQAKCKSPLVVERPPRPLMHPVVPVLETLMDEAFKATRMTPGTWKPVPFTGFSDHAIFADASVAVPTVQIAHIDDRFNHSAADGLDKISPIELHRAISAATATALVFACHEPRAHAIIEAAVQTWHANQAPLVDFHCSPMILEQPRFTLNACLPSPIAPIEGSLMRQEPSRAPRNPIRRVWQGPFNLRAFLNDVSPTTRNDILARARHDPLALSALIHIGVVIDGTRDEATVIELACFDRDQAERETFKWALGQLQRAGWASSTETEN